MGQVEKFQKLQCPVKGRSKPLMSGSMVTMKLNFLIQFQFSQMTYIQCKCIIQVQYNQSQTSPLQVNPWVGNRWLASQIWLS